MIADSDTGEHCKVQRHSTRQDKRKKETKPLDFVLFFPEERVPLGVQYSEVR